MSPTPLFPHRFYFCSYTLLSLYSPRSFSIFSHHDFDGSRAPFLSFPQISRCLLNPASKDFFPWISGLAGINTIPVSKIILFPMFLLLPFDELVNSFSRSASFVFLYPTIGFLRLYVSSLLYFDRAG